MLQLQSNQRRNAAAIAASAVLDLLFPPHCVACGVLSQSQLGEPLLCEACYSSLGPKGEPRCPRCAQRCSIADLPTGDCGDCRGRRLLFTHTRTIGAHEGPLRDAVLKAKHAYYEPLAVALGQRLAAV